MTTPTPPIPSDTAPEPELDPEFDADRAGGPLAHRRWWELPGVMAVAISLFLHVAGFLMAAVIIFEAPKGGDIGEGDSIELAVMSDVELTEMMSMVTGGGPQFAEELTQEQPVFEIEDLSAPLADLDNFTRDLTLITGLSGAGDSQSGSADGAGIGDVALSSAVGASFFGVEARGSRFAYIIDVSGSMQGPRITALQRALLASIQEMTSDARFSIILYSGFANPLTGSGWIRANDRGKLDAERKLAVIRAQGETNPIPAFRLVLDLKPRPDAIYFMTDGEFTDVVESRLRTDIARMTRTPDLNIPIHCITFVERSSEPLMRLIARQTGGSYNHVEGPR